MASIMCRRLTHFVNFKPQVRHMAFMDKVAKEVQSRNPLNWKDYGDGLYTPNRPPKHADIVVIGGGVIGSSVAYFLRRQAELGVSVLVVERDLTYTRASSVLAVGGIRQQFSVPENILMSLYSAHFLKNIKENLCVNDADPPDIQFNEQGYLMMAAEKNAHLLEQNVKLQTELGAKIELMTGVKLKQRFPWLNTEGVQLASYGLENEGWFDPYLLTQAFRHKAGSLGACYCNGEVVGFECSQVVSGMEATGLRVGEGKRIKSVKVRMPNSPEIIDVDCSIAVLCAGAWSGKIAETLNIGLGTAENLTDFPLPVEPRKRFVYVCHCPNGPGIDAPMVINMEGTYFRREGIGGNYIFGAGPASEKDEPDTSDLNVDYDFFDDVVWPSIAKTVPAFETVKLKSAWAGFYDYNTVDQNAVIGAHPAFPNLLMATGFSGHGIQQSPAVGQAISDLVFECKFKEIDLTRLSFERFLTQSLVLEKNII